MNTELYERKVAKNYFTSQTKEMIAFLPEKCSRLLDVGCGGGDFGALVKEEKCRSMGRRSEFSCY